MIAVSPISLRDPAGRVVRIGDRILRVVPAKGASNLEALLRSSTLGRFVEAGQMCSSRVLPPDEASAIFPNAEQGATVLEHDRVEFVSYPSEWPAEMLFSAAELTLDLSEGLLDEGRGLKDATPYNVLFRGTVPVFVDVLSVEPRDAHDPIWLAYAQFVRTMLLPLLLSRRLRVPVAQTFCANPEGLEPEQAYRMLSWPLRLCAPELSLVTLPTWLAPRHAPHASIYAPKRMSDPDRANFTLRHTFRALRRKLHAVRPMGSVSAWSGYATQPPSYTEEQQRAKQCEVDRLLALAKPTRILDIGCNTGVYSEIACRHAARVVAIDGDCAVVGALCELGRRKALNVLPLVVDIARPTPATGWRNREHVSFLERARGQFDCVLMLALIHHLLVTSRIPLDEIVELVTELTTAMAIVEYIDRNDQMFRALLRGREALHVGYDRNAFESAFGRRFVRESVFEIPGSKRAIYAWRKR
ncbi:MAG TPA: class I SAM-dependent methyltransferase [Terriglobales bacterium]|nr:class I SAM-dependent methyltransferase [Terriglobales bacterium]